MVKLHNKYPFSIKKSSKTISNFNNEIGMPLSIMNASSKSKNIVLEIGASKFNDIDYLSKIIQPSYWCDY